MTKFNEKWGNKTNLKVKQLLGVTKFYDELTSQHPTMLRDMRCGLMAT